MDNNLFTPKSPNPAPQETSSRKWIVIILLLLLLGVIAIVLASSGFFKGALYVDERIKEEKIISDTAAIETDSAKVAEVINCDVVIAGAGSGGFTAAIASAREGADTCLVEETDWLGGMMTAAGVAAIDGRPDTPSGIFYEIIQAMEEFYSSESIHSCTVSYLCFEPGIGNLILKKIAKKEKNLQIFYNARVNKVYREGNKIGGIGFMMDGKNYLINADVTIDATEFGDLMYLGNIDYDLGLDQDSRESLAREADSCIQPLTYVAILKKQTKNSIIDMPADYDREKFRCVVASPLCPDSNSLFNVARLKSYGRMPNGKLMINIPSHSYGNDFHATSENLENFSREEILEEAKNYSRGFIYFLQTELGFEQYALYNEFETTDSFAKIPYVRESRRLKGVTRLTESDILEADGANRPSLMPDAIAIGDYPIDLHFCKYGKGDIFKSLQPYQIPYWVTIPEKIDGFMAADKNISVSHIVNGTTRLQPVTMSVGQAVGTAAAMASEQNIEPRDIDVTELQEKLIISGSNLFFFKDLPAWHMAYKGVARLAIKGLISGYGDLTFRPENHVNEAEFLKMLQAFLTLKNQDFSVLKNLGIASDSTEPVNRTNMVKYLYHIFEKTAQLPSEIDAEINFNDVKKTGNFYKQLQTMATVNIISRENANFRPNDNLTRAEAMTVIFRTVDKIWPES